MSESTELAVVENGHGTLSMVDGPEPASAIAYAAKLSTNIAAVLEPGNGFDVIQGRKHVKAEGWQTIAAMTGHTAEVEWSRPVEGIEPDQSGSRAWESRAIVRDQAGRVVAAGESMASPHERQQTRQGPKPPPWAGADYSIRSMAQTRALSRALASRMRYVVVLAGFAGAPAEEMPAEGGEQGPDPKQLARDRYRILTRDENGLAQPKDAVTARLGDEPEKLADDAGFAYVAFMLGVESAHRLAADEEPVEGEVVAEGDEALADKLWAETGGKGDKAPDPQVES